MIVHFVGAGPGASDLITIRGQRLIAQSRVCIWAGSLIHPSILNGLPEGATIHDSSKLTLEETTAICAQAQRLGLDVVRLHTGDPSIYSALREQQRQLDALGIAWDVTPGVSSFQAAAASLGCELTIPEQCQSVVLTRVAGRTPVPERECLERFADTGATLCLFLSVDQLGPIAKRLSGQLGASCPAAIVYRASWEDEEIVRGTLADIGEKTARAEIHRQAIIVVGWALNAEGPASRLYASGFSHGGRDARTT